MGALQSVMSFLPLVQQGFNLVSGAMEQNASIRQQQHAQAQALQHLQAQQKLSTHHQAEQNALARDRIATESRQAQEDRQRALRRAMARQRVAFGAQGINPSEGSAEAVLLGLFEETEQDRTDRERLDNLRYQALSQQESQREALNVLQRTQLQQQQRLNNMTTGYAGVNNLVGTGLQGAMLAGEVIDRF